MKVKGKSLKAGSEMKVKVSSVVNDYKQLNKSYIKNADKLQWDLKKTQKATVHGLEKDNILFWILMPKICIFST